MDKYINKISLVGGAKKKITTPDCFMRGVTTCYCEHPLVEENTIKCTYFSGGDKEVPEKCPLREKDLTIKLVNEKLGTKK